MDELKFIHYALALRALAGAWTTQDEDHCCIFLLHDIKLLRSFENMLVFQLKFPAFVVELLDLLKGRAVVEISLLDLGPFFLVKL